MRADSNSAAQTEAEQGQLGGRFSSAVEEEEVEETGDCQTLQKTERAPSRRTIRTCSRGMSVQLEQIKEEFLQIRGGCLGFRFYQHTPFDTCNSGFPVERQK